LDAASVSERANAPKREIIIMKIARIQSNFRKNGAHCGFTLIELLVVVLILSVLMAISTPLSLQAVADSQRKSCRSNMQTIANAAHAARMKSGAADFTAIIAAGVTTTNLPDLQAVPKCPNAGTYSLANGSSASATTFKVACSYTGHSTYEPGVDSN